jgi:hypothetical protein
MERQEERKSNMSCQLDRSITHPSIHRSIHAPIFDHSILVRTVHRHFCSISGSTGKAVRIRLISTPVITHQSYLVDSNFPPAGSTCLAFNQASLTNLLIGKDTLIADPSQQQHSQRCFVGYSSPSRHRQSLLPRQVDGWMSTI